MGDRNRPRTGEPDPDTVCSLDVNLVTGYDRRATFALGTATLNYTEDHERYTVTGSALRHPEDRHDDSEVGVKLALGRALLDLGTLFIKEAEDRVRNLNG